MADYQLATSDENGPVIRTADGAHIPPDPANRDYAEYLAWKEAGGVPDPYKKDPVINPALDTKPAKTTNEILGVDDVGT